MGPDKNHLEEVKLDAHKATLRHFKNEMEDNDFKPLVSLEEVDKIVRSQLGKNEEIDPAQIAEAPAEAEAEVPAQAEEAPAEAEAEVPAQAEEASAEAEAAPKKASK